MHGDWLSNADARVVNRTFLDKLADPQAVSDLAGTVQTFVKEKLRELAIVRALLPPEYFHPEECQRDENTNFLKKIVDLEPGSTAMTIPIAANAPGQYVQTEKVALNFGKITTPKYAKSRDELLTIEMPVTKIIENNGVKDLQTIEDYLFFGGCEEAIYGAASGTHRVHFQDTWEDATTRTRVDKTAITDTAALLEDNERRANTIVISFVDLRKFQSLDAVVTGSELSSKITVEGWKYNELFGMRVIPSIKSKSRLGVTFDAAAQVSLTKQGLGPVDKGRFWIFDEAERVGKFFSLEEGRFYIESHFGFVYWQMEELIALGLINVDSVAVCDLRLSTPGTGTWLPSTSAGIAAAYDDSLIA